MKAQVLYKNIWYKTDLDKQTDLSLPVGQVRCFHAPKFEAKPFEMGDFVGSVLKGAPVNYYNIALNPHGNGSHTECVGHITKVQESVNLALKNYHFIATLISVDVELMDDGDRIIALDEIMTKFNGDITEALIIRTNPNTKDKINFDYTETNPPYLSDEAMEYICQQGVSHLLIDLPSVDKEYDEGKLSCHNIFWNTNGKIRTNATITELIFVPDDAKDGLYLLNLQLAPINLDASPSRPVIYPLTKMN